MKKEARLLKQKSLNSLILSVEHFNRPWDQGRTDAVLMFMDHSFEMLLKAGILVAEQLDCFGVSIGELALRVERESLRAKPIRPGGIGQASSGAGRNDRGDQAGASVGDGLVPIAGARYMRMPRQHGWQTPDEEDR